eukprot:353025-Chlamydomonas_euryale.AAC.1
MTPSTTPTRRGGEPGKGERGAWGVLSHATAACWFKCLLVQTQIRVRREAQTMAREAAMP